MTNFESRDKEGPFDPSKKSRRAGGADDPKSHKALPQGEGLGGDASPKLPVDDDVRIQRIGVRLEQIDAKGAADFRRELEATPEQLRERLVFYLCESYHVRTRNKDVLALIAQNIDLVPDVDKTVLAQRFFESGEPGTQAIAANLLMFEGVDPELCRRKIEAHCIPEVVWLKNISFFPESLREEIFLNLTRRTLGDLRVLLDFDFREHIPPGSHPKILGSIIERLACVDIYASPSFAIRLMQMLHDFQDVDVQGILRGYGFDPEELKAIAEAHSRQPFPRFPHLEKPRPSVLRGFMLRDGELIRDALLDCGYPPLDTALVREFRGVPDGSAKIEVSDPSVPSLSRLVSFGRQFNRLLHRLLKEGEALEVERMAKSFHLAEPTLQDKVWGLIAGSILSIRYDGCFARATELLKLFQRQLTPGDLAPSVHAHSEVFLGAEGWCVKQLLAIGAWSLLEPEIQAKLPEGHLRTLLPRLQGVFGKPTSRELDHFRRYQLFDNFFISGFQTLEELGMLTAENLGAVGKVLPDIIRQAGTQHAWHAHRINLRCVREEYGAAPTPLSPAQVEFELRTLLEFYHQFNGVRAPDLYRVFRACKPRPGSNDDHEVQRAKLRDQQRIEWQAAFEESVLQQQEELHLDQMRAQYLDAWTRSGYDMRLRLNRDRSYPATNIPLSPKTIMVADSKMDEGEEPALSSQIQQGYKILRELVLSLSRQEANKIYPEIAQSARDELTRQRGAMQAWLNGPAAANASLYVLEERKAELSRLADLTKEIEAATDEQQLLRPMLQVRHKSFNPLIQKLLIAHALERQHNASELVASLDEVPQIGSVTALGEFIKNRLFDESFRDLQLSPEEAKAARKALPSFDLKAVMAARVERDTNQAQINAREHHEVVVYPTRGILAEVAGYFADACWTKHLDLMSRHPNAIALVFAFPKRHSFGGNDGSPWKELTTNKLVGACYLLQAKDTSGEDVIVLRGINPREAPFEKLSMQSFIEELIDKVVVPYAKELGAKKVVIPFDPEGHAQTNRFRVGAYLSDQYGEAPYVPLDHKGPSSNFNDRRIFDQCRLVRTIE